METGTGLDEDIQEDFLFAIVGAATYPDKVFFFKLQCLTKCFNAVGRFLGERVVQFGVAGDLEGSWYGF